MTMDDQQPAKPHWEEWERETLLAENQLGAALGVLVIRFESLTDSLRVALEQLCLVGIHDIYASASDLSPKLRSVLGHLPFRNLVWLLESLWDGNRYRSPFQRSLAKHLLELEEERDAMVHSLWWAESGTSRRYRFSRRQSRSRGEDVALDRIRELAQQMNDAERQVWDLHDALERSEFAERALVYGRDPSSHLIRSLEELTLFVERFPDARVERATRRDALVVDDSADILPQIDTEMVHPFGRRGWLLHGDWVSHLDAVTADEPLARFISSLNSALAVSEED